jgi:hypothetical protein
MDQSDNRRHPPPPELRESCLLACIAEVGVLPCPLTPAAPLYSVPSYCLAEVNESPFLIPLLLGAKSRYGDTKQSTRLQ